MSGGGSTGPFNAGYTGGWAPSATTFSNPFGGGPRNDVPDPYGGWGDIRDQDGNPATTSKLTKEKLDKMLQAFSGGMGQTQSGGGGGNGLLDYPPVDMPQPQNPLESIPPQFILPLMELIQSERRR